MDAKRLDELKEIHRRASDPMLTESDPEGWTGQAVAGLGETLAEVERLRKLVDDAERCRRAEIDALSFSHEWYRKRTRALEASLESIKSRFLREAPIGLPSAERAPSLAWAMYDDARAATVVVPTCQHSAQSWSKDAEGRLVCDDCKTGKSSCECDVCGSEAECTQTDDDATKKKVMMCPFCYATSFGIEACYAKERKRFDEDYEVKRHIVQCFNVLIAEMKKGGA